MIRFFETWAPSALSVLRIIAGFLMLWHGSQKLFGYPVAGQPGELSTLMLIGGIIEFFGGLLVLVGFFTRPAAFLLSGMMAVAYFMVHAASGFLPLVNKGELAAIYSFLFLYFVFAGPGPWSVDALMSRRSVA